MTEQEKTLMRDILDRYISTSFGELYRDKTEKLIALSEYMLKANERFNLTAITNPEDIALKHLVDSIAPLTVLDIEEGASVIDVGSGGGFPGLPMKIMRDDISLTMMDSTSKKVGYLLDASKALELDVRCVAARAEDAGREEGFRERYDWATARAVARLDVLCELCLPFVRPGGWFAALKGGDSGEEIREAERAVSLLGGETNEVIKYESGGYPRSIVLIRKIKNTSLKYPRQYANIIKTPLKGGGI